MIFRKNLYVVVMGAVGSGKSTLLGQYFIKSKAIDDYELNYLESLVRREYKDEADIQKNLLLEIFRSQEIDPKKRQRKRKYDISSLDSKISAYTMDISSLKAQLSYLNNEIENKKDNILINDKEALDSIIIKLQNDLKEKSRKLDDLKDIQDKQSVNVSYKKDITEAYSTDLPMRIWNDVVFIDVLGTSQHLKSLISESTFIDIAVIVIDIINYQNQLDLSGIVAKIFGAKKIILAINKIDKTDYSEEKYLKCKKDVQMRLIDYCGLSKDQLIFIPISSLDGENIVQKSDKISWYYEKDNNPLNFHECLELELQELRKLKELNATRLKGEDSLIFYVNDISKDELGVIGYLQYGTITSEQDYVTFLPPLSEEESYKFLINKILTYKGENILNFTPTDSITAEKYPVKLLLGKIQKEHLAEIKKGMVITKFRPDGKYSNFKWGNKFIGTLYLIYHPTAIKTQTSSNLMYNMFNTKCYFHQFKTSKNVVTNSINTSEFVKCWIETDEKIPLLKEITTDGVNDYGFFILYEGERAMAVGSIDKVVQNWEFKSVKE
ncbi:MAG: GTP-binding protein [Promethearchaeota archaeon]